MGYRISAQAIRMCPSNVKAVMELSPPTTKTELKSYLGFVGFFRRMVPNYSKICSGLYDLLKEDRKFEWSHEHQQSFEKLRHHLTTDPILVYIDTHPSAELTLTVDASATHIGGSAAPEGLPRENGRSVLPGPVTE